MSSLKQFIKHIVHHHVFYSDPHVQTRNSSNPLNPIHLASIHESPIPISTKPSSQSTELTTAIVVHKPLNTNRKQKMVEREPTSDEDMRSTVLAIVDEEIGLRAIWGGVFARVGVRSSLWHLSYALSL